MLKSNYADGAQISVPAVLAPPEPPPVTGQALRHLGGFAPNTDTQPPPLTGTVDPEETVWLIFSMYATAAPVVKLNGTTLGAGQTMHSVDVPIFNTLYARVYRLDPSMLAAEFAVTYQTTYAARILGEMYASKGYNLTPSWVDFAAQPWSNMLDTEIVRTVPAGYGVFGYGGTYNFYHSPTDMPELAMRNNIDPWRCSMHGIASQLRENKLFRTRVGSNQLAKHQYLVGLAPAA